MYCNIILLIVAIYGDKKIVLFSRFLSFIITLLYYSELMLIHVINVLLIVVCFVQFCSGSEGLLKLWTIKTNECVKTFDQHLEKVSTSLSMSRP